MNPIKSLLNKATGRRDSETMRLGEHDVVARALSPQEYRDIIEKLQVLPSVALSLAFDEKANLAEWIAKAFDVAFDEIFEILQIASGVDAEYLKTKATTPQVVRYVTKLLELNEVAFIAGKLQAVLGAVLTKSA
jgi:hypothetical protein